MGQDIVIRSFGTHDGTFHADEVTACALLLFCNCIDQSKVMRTRDASILNTCEYVCDVGGVFNPNKKRFDHHQIDYLGDFSSCGMILCYLKEQKIFSESENDWLCNHLVRGIDDHDCGRYKQPLGVCTFSNMISLFNSFEKSNRIEQGKAFFEAVNFAHAHIKRLLDYRVHVLSEFELVQEVLQSSSEALVFDKHIPWVDSFFLAGGEKHPALFLIMPSNDGWHLRSIPKSREQIMISRKLLPIEWAGLIEKDLEEQSGISGGIFCHKSRFLSVWKTRESALQALNFVLQLKVN